MIRSNTGSRHPLVWVSVLLIFLPILAYTVFQWLEKDKAEAVIESIYDRQLKSVLFTINQHAWDVFHTWTGDLSQVVRVAPGEKNGRPELASVLEQHPGLLAVLYGTASEEPIVLVNESEEVSAVAPTAVRQAWHACFRNVPEEVARARRNAREGYIRPLSVRVPATDDRLLTLLLFPLLSTHEDTLLFGAVVIDQRSLVHQVVVPKFNEMGSEDFVFSVQQSVSGEQLYGSDETDPTDFEKQDKLWILPELKLLIKLKGTTLRQLAHSRVRVNLSFLAAVNALLLLGTFYLFRNVQAQVRLARLKTDFVANVSHELRTPLSLIQMYAEMLEMGRVPSEERRQHYYQTIFSESVRLNKLISNILDFARFESERKEFHMQQTDLGALVKDTVQLYEFHLRQKGFVLNMELADNIPELVLDPDAVTQAFVNVLDNAEKYSLNVKQISIRLWRDTNWVVLSVRDQGIGIAANEQEKIFEKFYRSGDSLLHNTKGSGLGLALVRHIMAVHRGHIRVQSRVGEGSVFELWFPIEKQD
jgi:two-component system, OmpR family, phosphate regulon sensor histidine kinase PhoR